MTADVRLSHRRWLASFAGLATGEAGSSALRLVAAAWLAAKLGPEHFGLVSIGLAAAGYLGVVSQCGLDTVATRDVAARRDLGIRYLTRVTGLRLVLAAGTYAVFTVVVLLLGLHSDLRMILLGMGLLAVTQAFDVRWSLVAEERTGRAATAAIVGSLVLLVGVVTLVRSPTDLAQVVAVTLVADVVTQGLVYMASRRMYGAWRPTRPEGLARPLLAAGVPVAISRAARTMIITVDVVFVELFRPAADVGRYALGGRLVAAGITYLGLYQYTYLATMSKVVDDTDRVNALVDVAKRRVWLFGAPTLVALMLLVGVGIPRIFGDAYADSVGLVQVMLPALLLLAFTGVWAGVLLAFNRYWTVARIAGGAAAVNVATNLILLPTIGTVGASIATVAAEAVQLVLTRRCAKQVLAGLPPSG